MSEPRLITVKRWICGGIRCKRTFSKRSSIEGHMATCWKVPENRACLTCAHFLVVEPCCDGEWARSCGCQGQREWGCFKDIELEPGKPVVGCSFWELAS